MDFSFSASSSILSSSLESSLASILLSAFDSAVLSDYIVRREDLAEASRQYDLQEVDISQVEAQTTPIVALGSGASYRVFSRKLPQWDHVVAIKHLNSKTSPGLPEADIEEQRRTILREIVVLGQFKGHPNIVQLLGWGQPSNNMLEGPDYMVSDYETAYLITEYTQLGDLDSFLLKGGRQLSTEQLIKVCADVAEGLRALHVSRIVHGDVKPSNVLLFEDAPGRYVTKICDLGFSIDLDANDPDMTYRGTYLYNAPEVKYPNIYTPTTRDLKACDIWSFGLLVWVIFQGSEQDLIKCVDIPSILNKTTTFADSLKTSSEINMLRHIFSGCLKIDPSARFSIASLCEMLNDFNFSGSVKDFTSAGASMGNTLKSEFGIFSPTNNKTHAPLTRRKTLDVFDWQSLRYTHETKKRIVRRIIAIAGSQNNPQAADIAFEASKCFAIAFGVPRDDKAMVHWLKIAAKRGHKYAAAVIDNDSGFSTQQKATAETGAIAWTESDATTKLLKIHHHCARMNLIIPNDLEEILSEKDTKKVSVAHERIANQPNLDASIMCCLAASTGHVALIEALLQAGVDINAVELGSQSTPLMLALYAGQTTAASLLLRNGARIDIHNQYGHTAYDFLVYIPPMEIAELICLFKKSQHVPRTTFSHAEHSAFSGEQQFFPVGDTPLSLAARLGHAGAVKAYLEDFTRDYSDEQIFHAVECAVNCHQATISDMILQAASRIGKRLANPFAAIGGDLRQGGSVYDWMVFHGEERAHALNSTIEVLLTHKYDINGPNPSGLPPMYAAVASYPREPVIAAALLDHGASLNQTSGHEETLSGVLESAVLAVDESEELGCVQWLLDKDVPFQVGEFTPRPLAIACAHNAYGAARALLKHPATQIDAFDEGMTSLHAACMRDAPKMVQLLIEHGADQSAMVEPDFTPLEVAVLTGSLNVVKYYLEANLTIYNPNVNPPRSALEFYTKIPKMEQTRILQLLLRHPQLQSSALLNQASVDGRSVLTMAIASKKNDLALSLLRAGADVGNPHDAGSAWLHLTHDMQRIAYYTLGDIHQMRQYDTLLEAFVDRLKSQGLLEVPNAQAETVLFGAAFACNVGAVKVLLRAGASPLSATPTGATPLRSVLISGARGGWEMEYDWPTSWVGGWQAVKDKSLLSILNLLLDAGANPNARTDGRTRPLHDAVLAAWRLDSLACVNLLCRRGADLRLCLTEGLPLLQLVLEPAAYLHLLSGAVMAEAEEGAADLARLETVRGLVRLCAEAGLQFNPPEQGNDNPTAYAHALLICNPVGLKAMLLEGIECRVALNAGQKAAQRAGRWLELVKEKMPDFRHLAGISQQHWAESQRLSSALSLHSWERKRRGKVEVNFEIIENYLGEEIRATTRLELDLLLSKNLPK